MDIAYEDVAGFLRGQVREAELDHEALSMPLKLCRLADCRATCCHDGVYLGEAERRVIGRALEGRRVDGWQAEEVFEERDGRWKSAVVEAEPAALADGFPGHFPKTRCVFLDGEHRCVLQRIAMEDGRHPWFWKPVSCWMHPLLLLPGVRGGRPKLTLARPGSDPAEGPGYPGFSAFTPCGTECGGGQPAWQVLRGELDLLGGIGGRDLYRELAGVSPGQGV